MSSPNTPPIIEREICLTGCTVARKMEFGDIVGELKIIKLEIRVVLAKTFEVVD